MKKKILIIVAAVLVPFLALLVLFYFLYPHLNEEKYEQIMSEIRNEQTDPPVPSQTEPPAVNEYYADAEADEISYEEVTPDNYMPADSERISNNVELLLAEQNRLQSTIDSLNNEKETLIKELGDLSNSIDSLEAVQRTAPEENNTLIAQNVSETREEFSERVKSLLNLEEEQLSPIVRKLDDNQLIRLYDSAGNIQREKLLRSLTADRAAKLMEKIMS